MPALSPGRGIESISNCVAPLSRLSSQLPINENIVVYINTRMRPGVTNSLHLIQGAYDEHESPPYILRACFAAYRRPLSALIITSRRQADDHRDGFVQVCLDRRCANLARRLTSGFRPCLGESKSRSLRHRAMDRADKRRPNCREAAAAHRRSSRWKSAMVARREDPRFQSLG